MKITDEDMYLENLLYVESFRRKITDRLLYCKEDLDIEDFNKAIIVLRKFGAVLYKGKGD